MIGFFVAASAVIMLLLNIPFDIFTASYSWWAVPLIFVGIFLVLVLLLTAVVFSAALFVNLNKPPRDTDFFRSVMTAFLKTVFPLLRIKVHSTGLEKIPEDERFLLVCNHIHDLDPAIIYHEVSDSRLSFIAKKEVRNNLPTIYRLLHKLNGMPIDRENNREAAKTIINASRLIKNGTNSVAVFPEGYTSRDGELQPIRNGALKIATKSQSKIVVCTLWGTRDIVKNLFRRKTDIYFDVLEVIDTTDNEHTVELGDRIHELMEKSIEEHKKEEAKK